MKNLLISITIIIIASTIVTVAAVETHNLIKPFYKENGQTINRYK